MDMDRIGNRAKGYDILRVHHMVRLGRTRWNHTVSLLHSKFEIV